MLSSQCLSCNHVNPADAKFCNECGSLLRVKLCSQCEALNDRAAKTCFKCGMEFATPAIRPERAPDPPPSSARNAAAASAADGERLPFRLDFLDELPKPPRFATEPTAAAAAPIASEPSLADAAASPAFQPPRPPAAIDVDKLDRAREAQSLAASVSAESVPSLATASPSAKPARVATANAIEEWRPSRVGLAVLLPIMALIAIGIVAYYFYGDDLQFGQRHGVPASSAVPEAVSSGASSIRPIQETELKAPSAPSASPIPASAPGAPTSDTAPPVEPSTAVTNPPVGKTAAAPPNDERATVPDAQPARPCTDGVAALGLCRTNSTAGSK